MTITRQRFGLSTLRIALLGLCTAAAAVPVLAQDGPPPPPPQGGGMHHGDQSGRMLKRLTRELNLSPDQVSQIQAIQADEATKMQALQADSADAGPGKHKQMKAIHEDGVARTRAVLTDDQKPKFDAMLAQQKEREQEHRQNGGAPPPPPPAPQQ